MVVRVVVVVVVVVMMHRRRRRRRRRDVCGIGAVLLLLLPFARPTPRRIVAPSRWMLVRRHDPGFCQGLLEGKLGNEHLEGGRVQKGDFERCASQGRRDETKLLTPVENDSKGLSALRQRAQRLSFTARGRERRLVSSL